MNTLTMNAVATPRGTMVERFRYAVVVSPSSPFDVDTTRESDAFVSIADYDSPEDAAIAFATSDRHGAGWECRIVSHWEVV